MPPESESGGGQTSNADAATVEGTPVLQRNGTTGWRESLLKLGQADDTISSTSIATDEPPPRAAGGWRSSVLGHSKAVRTTEASAPDPASGASPSGAADVQASPSFAQDSTAAPGAEAEPPGGAAGTAIGISAAGAAGPSIVAGRLTASGVTTSARQLSPYLGGLPQPQRLRDPISGAASTKPKADAEAGGTPAVSLPDTPTMAPQGSAMSPLLVGWSGLGDEKPAPSGTTPTAATFQPTGWRTALSAVSHGAQPNAGPSERPSTSPTRAQHSLWRNITKSLSGRLHRQDSGAAEAHASPSGRSEKPSRLGMSFRTAASLPQSGDSPKDGAATAPDNLETPTRSADEALPGTTSVSVGRGGGWQERVSRIEAAAERAVREVDAENDAERNGTVSDGERQFQKSASRRLRFNSESIGSAHSTFAGSHGSHPTSRVQSFRDRVASALGLGALVGSGKAHESGTEESGTPSPAHPQHSVLKKEGTSKQLRLGFTGSDDEEEEDDESDDGRSPLHGRGPTGGAVLVVKPQDDPEAVTPFAARRLPGGTAAGRGQPDSAVVPGRLHVSLGQMDMQVRDLEDTLMSPASLLPPGESLPPPLPRTGALLAKSSSVSTMAGGSETGMLLLKPGGSIPGAADQSELTPSQLRLQELRNISMKAARAAAAAGDREPDGMRTGATTAAPSAVATLAASAATTAAPSAAPSAMPSMTSKTAPPGVPEASASSTLKARSTIKLPIITTGHWDSLVFATVWRVGRVFGFQAFNIRPSTQDDTKREYVPAAIFVAADHLIQLLVKNGYVRRHRGDDTDEERFAKALFEFHSTIFYSYEMQWIKMQKLSPRAQRFTDELRERVFSEHHVINGLLCELALYFLIYTEAANMRFCAEAMWMIFWCMNHSYVMADLWNKGSPDRVPNGRDRLPQLRNTYQHLIKDLQIQISIRPSDMRPEDCGKMSSILSRLATADVPLFDRELLADLVSYGDGGFFMDRIVTPIFHVMSYEIDHLSTLGVDTAHRLGYDDFNESLTCRDVVYGALLDLRVTPHDIATGASNDAYHSLTSLGFQGRTVINNKFDPQVAAEWWRHRVFVKTYRERRSWWGVYRAFYRVYAFHFVLFHLMQAQAFAGWDWRVVSSAILTHAWLKWLERVANWMMTMPTPEPLQTTMTKIFDRKGFYKIDQLIAAQQLSQKQRYQGGVAALNNTERLKLMKAHQAQAAGDITERLSVRQLQAMRPERILEIEGAPLYGLFGGLTEWLLIATALTALYVLQFVHSDLQAYALDNWGYVAAGYTGVHLLHFLLTTRDGYCISLAQALHLPAYFQNWSSRPQPRTWLYKDMHIKWKNFFVNVFFWLMVLAMKIPFDYFVIHKPLVKPLRLLLTRNWMGCKGDWYNFGDNFRLPCIGGDWILVSARVFPFIIVALFDTALFYQFIVTLFGIYHGLIKLDLGVVSSWEDLVREFHKSPPRWWIRCMSFTGNENQKNLLFHTIETNAKAASSGEGAGDGAGEDGMKNVAISDGLMFKIKIVTPEEIRAKQGLMLKERKINMQAGKGGPANEVEVKAVKAVHDKTGAAATGGAANTRPGAGALAPTSSVKTTGGGAAPAGGKAEARSLPGATGAASAPGGGPRGPETGAKAGTLNRHMISVNGRNGVTLVGQDFKEAQSRPQGLGKFFSLRGQTGDEGASAAGHGMMQLPGVVPLPGARSGGLGPGQGAAARGNVGGSGVGNTPALMFGTRRGSAGEESSAPGNGMVGKMKVLGTAGLATAIFARKGAQVQPEPIAEAVEDRYKWSGREEPSPSAAAPALVPSFKRPRLWASSAVAGPPPRARASLHRLEGPPSARHPAWQPEALLGPGHRDYDPAQDPMSPANVQRRLDDDGLGVGRSAWRFWSWRQGRTTGSLSDGPGGAGAVPGPAMASLRVHGWRPESEVEVWRPDSGSQALGAERQLQRGAQGDGEARAGGALEGARVYRGALGEGVTLVGPDGRPLPDDSEEPQTRPAPFVLLSEVPMLRVDSEGSSAASRRESMEQPIARAAGGISRETRRSMEVKDSDMESYRNSRGGLGAADNGDEAVRGGRPAGTVRFNAAKFEELTVVVPDDTEDVANLQTPKSNKTGKAAPSPRKRSGFLASFFRSKFSDLDSKPAKGGGDDDKYGRDGDDDDVRSRQDDDEDDDGDPDTLMSPRSRDRRGSDASVRRGDTSSTPSKRGMDVSSRPSRRSMEVSVRGGPRKPQGEMSVRGGRKSIDMSVRGGRKSMDMSVRGGKHGLGPAAAGFGMQSQKSMTGGGGLLNRRASFAGGAHIQRVRSISAAASTNFEQKQFAKMWERQHSVAAQVVKHDLATRTTSMVLMGTEDLQNMEDDDLDVVSEQMMMWSSFAEAWDAICDDLREDDLISDKEMSLLKFVRLESSGKLHGLRPILLPTFFFAGQIRKVVDTGRVTTAQVMVLTEFRVLITWLACQLGIMSGKHAHVIMTASLYGGIINVKHINLRKKSFDSAIKLIGLVDQAIRTREVPFEIQAFAEYLLSILNGLESECYAVQKMWEIGRVSDDDLDGALTLFEVVQDMQERVRSDPEELKQCLKRAVAMEDLTTNTNVLLQVTTVLKQMLTTTSADATPQGEEAQRVLGFFINSLGHPSLDKPQSVEFMLSWSVLTPVYEEDVLYAVDSKLTAEELGLPYKKITDLLSETDDGFSLMAYLRAMFAFEWNNFKERMKRLVVNEVDIPDWSQVTELDFGAGGLLADYRTELQLWASYRGQLLARTVRGMMCYERALKVICRMEYPTPMGITDNDYERWVEAMVGSKFEYVIAVQTYGRNAKSNDLRLRQLSQSVDTLVQRFPSLKVAYLDDAVDRERYGPTQYSVLIRNRRASDPIADPTRPFNKIAEAYRIRLPFNKFSNRGVVLGEGKPENQNHAAVFVFNEGLQAIDMNQDNYLAEALKMRNLLSELNPSNKGAQFLLFADDTPNQALSPHMTAAELRFVILSRMKRSFPTAIVGFREWIFSANTGALGQYAAATEYSFATIQSRIMTKPPRVRMHYGHPDVFNKTFIMTRGGMSKGTRTLHISEDYFIGAAHTLRGARIRYKEYISCGKGRDMGFDSILSYQKKISGGAADLATSREVHRLGTRLEFFRLLSFYHGGIGHFLNSYLTLKAAWYNIWALLLTAMAQAMEVGLEGEKGSVTLTQTYNVQQVLQLGTLSIIPYVGQLILETGLLRTVITVFGQIITGSLFFYIFQQQTVAASFSAVMSFGGMRYIGTGRGFSIQTTDFVKMYTLYARTHLYLGFEVMFFCVTLYALNDCASCNYAALTWNSWLLAFVMILCPLWFNPFIFHLNKVQRDYMSWKRWLSGDVDAGTGTNWFTWNREQLSKPRNDDGNVTDAWRNAFREIVGTCLPYVLLVLAMVSRIDFKIQGGQVLNSPYIEFLLATALMWIVVLLLSYVGHNLLERAKSKEWRIIRYVMTLTGVVLFIVYMVVLTRFYSGNGFTHIMRVAYANFIILVTVHRSATYLFTQNNTVRDFVDAGYYLIDVLVGYGMFGILALLSFVGVVNLLQSKLLFNEAFSQSVQTARIKMQVKRSGKQIKRKVKPGLLMTMDEWMRSRPASGASVAPSMAPTVYEGGAASRVVSLAPSKAPSAMPSAAPSALTSAAPSAFTSAANSGNPSRRNSMTEVLQATATVPSIRPHPSRRGLGSAEAGGTAVGLSGGAGGLMEAGSGGGATLNDPSAADVGLRERRLRFG